MLLITQVFALANENGFVMPKEPILKKPKIFSIERGANLAQVLEKWTQEEWGKKGALYWSVGDYEQVKRIKFPASVDFGSNLKESLQEMFYQLSMQRIIKDSGIIIYSCVYTNEAIKIRAELKDTFINRRSANDCN